MGRESCPRQVLHLHTGRRHLTHEIGADPTPHAAIAVETAAHPGFTTLAWIRACIGYPSGARTFAAVVVSIVGDGLPNPSFERKSDWKNSKSGYDWNQGDTADQGWAGWGRAMAALIAVPQ